MGVSDDKVEFDGWTLTKSTGDLAKAGFVTRLQQQPLQVLIELVDHAGDLVTRDQLIARLWPKGIVEFDTSLNTAVRKLRVALNDDPEHPRFIETIPRRGYRFLVPVTAATQTTLAVEATPTPTPPLAPPVSRSPPATEAPTHRRRVYVASGLLLVALAACAWWYSARPTTPSLVVLPFVDMTTDQKDAALCNGITEELIGRLSQLQNVHVVARTSAFAYQGKTEDVRAIGKTLGVTHVIEGSVRRDGGALRVTLQLVSSEDGMHFYSESFDFVKADLFDVQQTIAQAVTQEMRVWFSP
jgi:TolB-like protein/DNA-binding winged helix-turn-helix (wHTH) protein